jgi:O-succinylbenzoic acid--CoA ligase
MMIPCPVDDAAHHFPDAAAYYTESESHSFAEFGGLVATAARRLEKAGIGSGERVAIVSRTSLDYVLLLFALARIGAIAIPINLRRTAPEWDGMIAQSAVKHVFVDHEHEGVADQSSLVIHRIEDELRESDVLNRNEEHEAHIHTVSSEQETTIVFTSGSSGKPKGVVLTYGNHYFNALGSNENIRLQPGDCWLLSLPLYHVGGLSILYRCMLAGAAVRLVDRFDVDTSNALIDSGLVTHISLVPTMLTMLLAARGNRPFPTTLKTILLSGAAASQGLIEAIRRLALPVVVSYGMTETASQICATSPGDPRDRLTTVGRPLKYRELCVTTGVTGASNRDEPGEIFVRGEVLCKRYSDDAAASIVDGEGWFHTGDLGYLDSNGYLVLVGRKDEMFVSGGENIYPREIETIAESCPGVAACRVIAVPDPHWGERPALFVECSASEKCDKVTLESFLRQRLSAIKMPREVFLLPSLPRTAIGKIDKVRLVEQYRQLHPD